VNIKDLDWEAARDRRSEQEKIKIGDLLEGPSIEGQRFRDGKNAPRKTSQQRLMTGAIAMKRIRKCEKRR